MNTVQNYETIQDVELFASQNGIRLTPADKRKIAQAQQAELERLQALETDSDVSRSWVDTWNDFYPRLLQAIVTIGETLITVSQTLIVSLGVPIILILLLIVEHTRVTHGIQLFETNYNLASFGAWSLVGLNLVLEFVIHHIEHKHGYNPSNNHRWSLRLWLNNMSYRLGLGDNWQALPVSPASNYKGLLRLVTFSILALALAGSMKAVIADSTGAWYQAIGNIITQSTLSDMTTWLGGLLFAAAAVLSAQALSRYVAIRAVEVKASLTLTDDTSDRFNDEIEYTGASVAMALVQAKLDKQRAKESTGNTGQDTPLAVPVYQNGHTPTSNGVNHS